MNHGDIEFAAHICGKVKLSPMEEEPSWTDMRIVEVNDRIVINTGEAMTITLDINVSQLLAIARTLVEARVQRVNASLKLQLDEVMQGKGKL